MVTISSNGFKTFELAKSDLQYHVASFAEAKVYSLIYLGDIYS